MFLLFNMSSHSRQNSHSLPQRGLSIHQSEVTSLQPHSYPSHVTISLFETVCFIYLITCFLLVSPTRMKNALALFIAESSGLRVVSDRYSINKYLMKDLISPQNNF